MKERLLSIATCLIIIAGLFAGTALPVLAQEDNNGENVKLELGDTTWQENYKYFLNFTMEEIVLKKYIGSEENVVIPAKAVVGGATYNVRLNNDCTEFFSDCKSVKTVDFSALNTRNVTDTSRMFEYCENLTGITGFNTSNVTKMAVMFHNCESLTSTTVGGFDTRNVTNMNYMFEGCTGLEKIPDFDTRNVTGMSGMFYKCSNLSDVNSNILDTHNVQYMDDMFNGCTGLTSVNLNNWDTRNVKSLSCMFFNCENLKDVDLSGFNTSNLEDTSYMFEGCFSLSDLNVSTWDTHNLKKMYRMFSGCGVRHLDLSKWNLSKVENAKDALDPCSRLETIEIPTNLKQDVGFGYWYYKQVKFARADDPTVVYTALPKEEKVSFTIVRVQDRESGNVISIDYDAGTAVVVDEVEGSERTVPISTIEEGYVYRMYNPFSGEHFYTKDAHERDYLVGIGWHHEAESDYIATDARDDDAITIYRLYNPAEGGMHFYTADAIEVRSMIKAGWTYEGVAYYGIEKHSEVGYPLYRVYNPYSPGGQHVWTTDVNEYSTLIANDWVDEDVCWNILTDDGSRSKEIVGSFRYIDPDIPELICTYTFNADGTGTYDISGEGKKLTYAIYGNELSIMFEGQDIPMNVEFTVDAEALTIIDGTGAYMVYYRI